MDNIEMAMGTLETKMAKALKGISDSIDARIATTVKNEIANSIEFHVNNHLQAIQKISVNKALTPDQLTRLYQDVYQALQDLKINTNGYGLYEQMQQLNEAFQKSRNEINDLSKNFKKFMENKYIETDITKEQLRELYETTHTTADELAKKFNLSIPEVYNVLNCKRKDLKLRNELKSYMEKKYQEKGTLNASV